MEAKKPKLCVFCGGDRSMGLMNKEHFVPKCLWADQRPPYTKTVPAHKECNSKFASDNDYFRDVLIMEAGRAFTPKLRRLGLANSSEN